MRTKKKIRLLAWNANGLNTHVRELAQAIQRLLPDLVTLNETRSNANEAFRTVWPGARVTQVAPKADPGRSTRAGVAVAIRTGAEKFKISPSWRKEDGN